MQIKGLSQEEYEVVIKAIHDFHEAEASKSEPIKYFKLMLYTSNVWFDMAPYPDFKSFLKTAQVVMAPPVPNLKWLLFHTGDSCRCKIEAKDEKGDSVWIDRNESWIFDPSEDEGGRAGSRTTEIYISEADFTDKNLLYIWKTIVQRCKKIMKSIYEQTYEGSKRQMKESKQRYVAVRKVKETANVRCKDFLAELASSKKATKEE